jgi:NAD(P)-dependent dehydrogenase (short-subunit alcohol dehydrogenase family)
MKALILGASSDIGLQICRTYLANGWSVIAHYRTHRQELADLFENNRSRVQLLRLDFNHLINDDNFLEEYRQTYIDCDAFINCAANYQAGNFLDITSSSLIDAILTNTVPGLLITRDLVQVMAKKGWGRIVHLSSIGVKFGGGNNSYLYSLSKHALEFMPADYKKWAAHNVLINTLRVGVTNTRIHTCNPNKNLANRVDLIPIGRMAEVEEIAKAAWFFGSSQNTYITGQILSISGGE